MRVAIFCPTFLKPEMLHVYRQVAGLPSVEITALAFKRENADRFPFEPVRLIKRTPWRELRRFWRIRVRRRPTLAYPSEVQSLEQAMKEENCALLHIYFGNNGLFWLPYLRRSNQPVIVSFHGADVQVDLASTYSSRLLHELFSRSALVLARSQSLADTLIQRGCPPAKIRIQRTGIPLNDYPYVPRTRPEKGRWRLLQACRLVEKKGLETTVAAFAKFHLRWPGSVLTIAGDGPLKVALEGLIQKHGLQASVRMTGFLKSSELRQLYYDNHFFLHPSEIGPDGNREGVPNGLLEAMATGLPAVATFHGGIPEAIENGKSGLLVAESDSEAVAEALFRLANDPELAGTLAANGSATVQHKYDLERQRAQLEEIYLGLNKTG